jgi:hypothetical protein
MIACANERVQVDRIELGEDPLIGESNYIRILGLCTRLVESLFTFCENCLIEEVRNNDDMGFT